MNKKPFISEFVVSTQIMDSGTTSRIRLPSVSLGHMWKATLSKAVFFIQSTNINAAGNLPGNFQDLPCSHLNVVVSEPCESYGSISPGIGFETHEKLLSIIGSLVPEKMGTTPNLWKYSLDPSSIGHGHAIVPPLGTFEFEVVDPLLGPFPIKYAAGAVPEKNMYCYYNNVTTNIQPCTPFYLVFKFTAIV